MDEYAFPSVVEVEHKWPERIPRYLVLVKTSTLSAFKYGVVSQPLCQWSYFRIHLVTLSMHKISAQGVAAMSRTSKQLSKGL